MTSTDSTGSAAPAVEPFDAVDVIRAKRDGRTLEPAQIDWVMDAYTRGVVAEEQMAPPWPCSSTAWTAARSPAGPPR